MSNFIFQLDIKLNRFIKFISVFKVRDIIKEMCHGMKFIPLNGSVSFLSLHWLSVMAPKLRLKMGKVLAWQTICLPVLMYPMMTELNGSA